MSYFYNFDRAENGDEMLIVSYRHNGKGVPLSCIFILQLDVLVFSPIEDVLGDLHLEQSLKSWGGS